MSGQRTCPVCHRTHCNEVRDLCDTCQAEADKRPPAAGRICPVCLRRHFNLTRELCAVCHAKSRERDPAEDAAIDRHVEAFGKVIAEVGKRHGRFVRRVSTHAEGTMTCPICGGTLAYRRSAHNGHVAVHCPGPDPVKGPCLAVMQ
jgi:hypothetical protein